MSAPEVISTDAIEVFLREQTAHWNSGDKSAFMAAYRRVAPLRLSIDYVGKGEADGWPVLEQMWEQQQSKIEVEPVSKIVNGNEAACHVRNLVRGTDRVIETIELFRFEPGALYVRYFIKQ